MFTSIVVLGLTILVVGVAGILFVRWLDDANVAGKNYMEFRKKHDDHKWD